MERYLQRTYLGERTVAHNSSFGCPFSCSFCAVVAMTNRRWLAQSPARIERVIRRLIDRYGVDSVQMHDMDFFISESRVAEIAERLTPLNIKWWALGRVDILMQYSERTWAAMAASGLKMVFSGAESASEQVLKTINPASEIILYTYTPVPMDATLYSEASRLGFRFPQTLDEWASDSWQQTSLRRGDGIPWLDATVKRRIRNFERVLNAFYPTTTDRRLTGVTRALLRTAGAWRYALRLYAAPYELRALQRLLHYQRPETTGF